jgi:hypothetical protein
MEVLRFQVQREHVGEQDVERTGNILGRVGRKIGRRIEGSFPSRYHISRVHGMALLPSSVIGHIR